MARFMESYGSSPTREREYKLSLRDTFALKAFQEVLGAADLEFLDIKKAERIARASYALADEMLRIRKDTKRDPNEIAQ